MGYGDNYHYDFKIEGNERWEDTTPIMSIAPIGILALGDDDDIALAAAEWLASATGRQVRWAKRDATQGHYVNPSAKHPALAKTEHWSDVANSDERLDYTHCYIVHLAQHSSGILVYAESEQDALDEAADFVVKMGWEGYWCDEETIAEYEKEGWEDELVSLGNDGHMFIGEYLHIEQVY